MRQTISASELAARYTTYLECARKRRKHSRETVTVLAMNRGEPLGETKPSYPDQCWPVPMSKSFLLDTDTRVDMRRRCGAGVEPVPLHRYRTKVKPTY